MRQLSRRATLVLGVGGAALTVLGWNGRAQAGAKEAAEQIAKFTGGKTATQGKISIELPEIAENGNTVPLSVAVDAPMTADNYVSEVMVVAEGNPNPGVATFHFSADVGQGGSRNPHQACHHAEHRRGRQDQQGRVLYRPEAGEGHHRRLRRLTNRKNSGEKHGGKATA